MNDRAEEAPLTEPRHWQRLAYMFLFMVIISAVRFVLWVLIPLQFLFTIFTGNDNHKLRKLGADISEYVYQILQFLTYNSEDKPYPFDDWPDSDQ